MTIRLLAFASAAEILGASETTIELPDGATVGDLRRRLEADHAGLGELWDRLAVAVDGDLVDADAPLADGAEVALLPPVSGGSGRDGSRNGARDDARDDAREETRTAAPVEIPVEPVPATRLVEGPLDVPAVLAAVADPSRGAVVLFVGTVRDHHRGQPVTHLDYSAYRPMAAKRLVRITRELEEEARRDGDDLAVAVVHRLGRVEAGAASVAIATSSTHRARAYAASRTALERLKREVPIWKREHLASGEAIWREEEPLGRPSPPDCPR